MRDFNTTRFTNRIAITEEDLDWIKKNKGKKSAAGFLEEIIKTARDRGRSPLPEPHGVCVAGGTAVFLRHAEEVIKKQGL